MITEQSTPKTRARAFSFLAFTGNLGILIGPLIGKRRKKHGPPQSRKLGALSKNAHKKKTGGALADPAKQYGGIFARIKFLQDYPYSLPSFVTGTIGLSGAVISALFVEETLESKTSNSGKAVPRPMSTWELIRSPGVATVLFLYNYILLLGMAFTAVAPVFWFTSVRLGGLGFSPLLISLFLGIAGLSQAIWTLLVFPPAQHRWGTGGVLRFCGIIWPISFVLSPLGNWFLRQGWKAAFWVVVLLGSILGSGASMAFTCVQLALNDISPSPAVLGTLNAVGMVMTAGVRAVAPALFASTFAMGVRNQILWGYLAWVILILMAVGGAVFVRSLPAKAQGMIRKKPVAEDENAG